MLPGGRIVIRANFAEPLERYPAVFRTYHPQTSIVLDFPPTRVAVSNDARKPTFRGVRSIHVMQAGHLARMVVRLDEPLIPEIALKNGEMGLTLSRIERPSRERETWFQHATP